MNKSAFRKAYDQERDPETEASSTESTSADSPIHGRIVNANLVNVRMTPAMSESNVLTQVGLEDEFFILGTEGDFRKVRLKDGRVGFIHSNFCEVK